MVRGHHPENGNIFRRPSLIARRRLTPVHMTQQRRDRGTSQSLYYNQDRRRHPRQHTPLTMVPRLPIRLMSPVQSTLETLPSCTILSMPTLLPNLTHRHNSLSRSNRTTKVEDMALITINQLLILVSLSLIEQHS